MLRMVIVGWKAFKIFNVVKQFFIFELQQDLIIQLVAISLFAVTVVVLFLSSWQTSIGRS